MTSSFQERVLDLAARFPEHPAFLFEERWTPWGQVGGVRAALARELAERDVPTDAPIGVVLRERPSTCTALLAVLASGRCAVLLSSHLPDDALEADLAALRLRAVVADPTDWSRPGLRAHAWAVGTVGFSVDDEGRVEVAAEAIGAGSGDYDPGEGTAVAVLTSGTTGAPKRIPLSYAALDAAADRVSVREPGSGAGVTINVLPLTTIGGVRGIADTVWRGRPLALMERFDVWRWAALVRDHHPRRIGIPPAVLRTMLDEDVPAEWFSGVECLTTGSAPLHVPTVRAFFERYAVPVLNAYGSTEFGGRVAEWTLADWGPWHGSKLGSVGRPMRHVVIRVVDDQGAEAPTDEVGILEVRFAHDGADWLHTNDRARIDADGFLWMEGRADDVIIRGGFKVPVGEVEVVLEAHPSVAEAIVVGLEDERLGHVPAAAVTLVDGADEVTGDELVAWVRSHLVPYKVPRTVLVVDEIPRNSMMKPLRREVAALLSR